MNTAPATVRFVLLLGLALTGPALAQVTSGKDVEELLKWERDDRAVYERNGAAYIDRIVAEGYVLTEGRRSEK